MILNKTEYFLKIRKNTFKPYNELSIAPIKSLLLNLASLISQLENKIEINTLPNFGSKEKKIREIENLRERIQKLGKEIEKEVKEFNCNETMIKEDVQHYLLTNLSKLLSKFKNQAHINAFDQINNDQHPCDINFLEDQETIQRNNNIKTTICNVTNTLVQLKMALKAQTNLIDTIDGCFDRSNLNLEKANKEIEKIPEKYCGFKDYIIYLLLYTICILLILIFIKSNKNFINSILKRKVIITKSQSIKQ